MKRRSLLALSLLPLGIPAGKRLGNQNVHIFYYAWYGRTNGWRHWPQGGHNPPLDIGADLYPALGPYDSGDAGVIDQHMRWLVRAGVGVLVFSWWGQGSYEDLLVPAALESAARHGLKVAWHHEPYGGRTAQSTVDDIRYLHARYGGSPAFHNAFYVFESLRITDWSVLEQVRGTSVVLAQTTDTSKVAGFGGMYTYDAIAGNTAPGWTGASAYCRANGLVWAPSIGPGYIDDRAVPGNTTPTLGRENGATYDRQWANAINSTPTWVSITSFNEWHEGSVIEPASGAPPAGFGYETYGGLGETYYLDRTRYWAEHWMSRR
jgi:glycoprotein endo-alpha-1,2-mannosidase